MLLVPELSLPPDALAAKNGSTATVISGYLRHLPAALTVGDGK